MFVSGWIKMRKSGRNLLLITINELNLVLIEQLNKGKTGSSLKFLKSPIQNRGFLPVLKG